MNQAAVSRVFARCLLGLMVTFTAVSAFIYIHTYDPSQLFGDFATFRNAGLHALTGDNASIYDVATLRERWQAGKLTDFTAFLNPPAGLFLVLPLALLGPTAGLIAWSAGQLLLLLAVLRLPYFRRFGTLPVLAAAFASFALLNLLFGQVAAFCAVLFLLVLAWRNERPVAAGVMLGLFCFKPQLALLLPLLLIAEGNKKALIAALTTASLLGLASLLFWGPALWHDYADMLALRGRFLTGGPTLLFTISMSAYAALRNLGVAPATALLSQVLLALIVIARLWPVLKSGREADKALLLSLGAYLVIPYVLVYDMALLALPAALLLHRVGAGAATRGELLALILLIFMPPAAILLQIKHIPYSVIAIGFAFIVARSLALRDQPVKVY